ncbi:hypothetical protein BKA67DRAFT_673725 [Truncatella angustata]|uniref:Uncharacterized protein n=1 Tax=Truncatella angustata TaxID=152316 RepID=A0A9P8UT02_9PEZI|nr:uncharacterized protein BKA67DRAFT_673725 [Truncatella angustata]KAH6657927.1 hypothetical protein BKA67DRAFT_673725 [Truncatella angustata]KAH8193948.1 hypothetical protein TruAng_011885 [Truncatella angustata]
MAAELDPQPASLLTVLAVSRSQPATQIIHSQPTLTASVRSPSPTPLVLTEDGIEGHKSAIHDAQVYAFFAQHYDYWTSRLGVERSKWDWAFWGENLTLRLPDGIDERNIHLGDRWIFSHKSSHEESRDVNLVNRNHPSEEREAAGGVILEVCGGRNPCSRLAWRCGQPGRWLAEVAKSGFCGVYLRVIRGGSIAPGDMARIMPTMDEDMVSAASIAQCAYSSLADPATRVLAKRILRVSDLQNMNRQVITRKLAMIEENQAVGQNRWSGWRSLEVIKVIDESPSIKSFYLAAVDDQPLASYVPGQFLTIKLPSGQIRCWSISSWSPATTISAPLFYRITVKKGAAASLFLHAHVSVGSRLLVRPPSGAFVPDWTREFPPRQIYISAGIGITPVLSMIQSHFAHQTLKRTPAILVHVARNAREEIPLLNSELPSSPLLRTIKFYTAPVAGVDAHGRDFDFAGRPGFDFFATLLDQSYHIDPLGITPIELPGNASNAYICGPSGFVDTIRDHLERCKFPPQAIRHETFVHSSSSWVTADGPLAAECYEGVPEKSTVRFRGKEVKWRKHDGLSLLQLIEQEGGAEQPESGCRIGECGTCEMKILKGEARLFQKAGKDAQESSGKAGSMIRACCSYPISGLLELEF